jgi:hypothetical protein
MPLLQVFTTQIDELNRKFPTDLKKLFDNVIAYNQITINRTEYKTYTLLQYIYWLFRDQEPRLKNPFEGNYFDEKDPKEVLDEIAQGIPLKRLESYLKEKLKIRP